MAIDSEQILKLVSTAGRPVGIQELLRAGGFNPGEQTAVKRVLRDLVKSGQLTRDGKRFRPAEEKSKQKSGPAWGGKAPAVVRAVAGVKPKAALSRGSVKRFTAPEPEEKQKGPPRTRSTRGGKTVVGIIHHHRDGFAFVKPIVGQDSEDLFIPPDETRKTLDNDQVLVEVVPGQRRPHHGPGDRGHLAHPPAGGGHLRRERAPGLGRAAREGAGQHPRAQDAARPSR